MAFDREVFPGHGMESGGSLHCRPVRQHHTMPGPSGVVGMGTFEPVSKRAAEEILHDGELAIKKFEMHFFYT